MESPRRVHGAPAPGRVRGTASPRRVRGTVAPSDADLIAVRRAAYDRHRAEHGPRGLVCPPRRSAGRPGGSDPHGGMDRTRSAILSVHPAPNRTPRGELLRRRHPLPCRRGRRHPLSPSRIPSTTTPLLYPRPGSPRPRSACWEVLVVLVVRRFSHEAHAALAPGGVTYWNPGSSAS